MSEEQRVQPKSTDLVPIVGANTPIQTLKCKQPQAAESNSTPQTDSSAKRKATDLVAEDSVEKKVEVEQFPDTIFEDEEKRLLEDAVLKHRKRTFALTFAEKAKAILGNAENAKFVDDTLGWIDEDTEGVNFAALFHPGYLSPDAEPTGVEAHEVSRAVSTRLLKSIATVNGLEECRRYLYGEDFSCVHRKGRPTIEAICEEAKNRGMLQLADLLSDIRTYWKRFSKRHSQANKPPVSDKSGSK